MKNLFYLLVVLCLLMPIHLSAQMQQQQAIVKTHARQHLDGTTSKCEYVSSAIITIKDGAQVVSDNRGALSFGVNAKSCYYINSAYKQGYQVTDMSVLTNGHYYSGNEPLIIYMQNIAALEQERASYKRVIRSHYQHELNQSQELIDSLRRNNLATTEELQALQQKVDQAWEEAENVVSDMTERYLLIDFDYATDVDKRISTLILNGKLEEAKREIGPESVEEKVRQVNIAQRVVDNAREDAARYCMHLVDIYTLENKRDSVAHYLDLRASLDRTNINWQVEAGNYIADYLCDYSRALSIYEPALKYSLDHYGESHFYTYATYNSIATNFYNMGNYSKAVEYCTKVVMGLEKLLGADHPKLAIVISNLGSAYSNLYDYDKALELHRRALDIRLASLGEAHVDTADSYNNIGDIYIDIFEYEKALEQFQRALQIFKQVYGENSDSVAIAYNNISRVYHEQGNNDLAIDYAFKSLDLKKRIFGDTHVAVATAYHNIAGIYVDEKEYEKAIEYYTMSLDMFIKTVGEKHPRTANTYNSLGFAYNDIGQSDLALDCYLKSMNISVELYGENSLDATYAYNNLGNLYRNRGEFAHALEYFNKALPICESEWGVEHLNTCILYANVGVVYDNLGEYSTALEYYRKALKVVELRLGEEHERTIQLKNKIKAIEDRE